MGSRTSHSLAGRRPNFFYAIISVAAVLFLVGFFGLLLLQTQQLAKVMKEQVDLIVELTGDPALEDRQALENILQKSPFVKTGSLDFTSREEALELMSDELGEEFIDLDLPNPLYDVYTFNVPARYLTEDSLSQIQAVLRQNPIVSDVYYQESLVDQLLRNANRLGWILLAVGVFFIVLALTVIHNTIRLSLYANRFLIKTQELVGATWEFISRPYLRRSLLHGFISGLLATGALVLIQWWLQEEIPELRSLQNPAAFGILFAGLILLGMLINWLSTYFVVRKYLRLRADDLY